MTAACMSRTDGFDDVNGESFGGRKKEGSWSDWVVFRMESDGRRRGER